MLFLYFLILVGGPLLSLIFCSFFLTISLLLLLLLLSRFFIFICVVLPSLASVSRGFVGGE